LLKMGPGSGKLRCSNSTIAGRCPAMPTSEMGLTEKHSARADVFRSSPKNGRRSSTPQKHCADRMLRNISAKQVISFATKLYQWLFPAPPKLFRMRRTILSRRDSRHL
jgi:hypothetical protein